MKKETASIIFFYLFLIACVIIFWMSGCSTAKDNRAFRRVVSDPELADKTFRHLERTRPSDCDTTIFGEEKIDTVYSNDFVFDPVSDTLFDTVTNMVTITKVVTKPVYITKTSYIEDVRRLNLAYSDTLRLYQQGLFKDGVIVQQAVALKAERKRGNGFMWMLVGLIACIMVYVFIKLKRLR